jgi:hypothetical protein
MHLHKALHSIWINTLSVLHYLFTADLVIVMAYLLGYLYDDGDGGVRGAHDHT